MNGPFVAGTCRASRLILFPVAVFAALAFWVAACSPGASPTVAASTSNNGFAATPQSGSAAQPTTAPAAANPTAATSGGAPAQPTYGAAAAVQPANRNEMYKTAPPMVIDVNKNYQATVETSKGNIVLDLFPKDAPQHVNNFVFLARDGFFDGLTFHRYEPGFVIQGGDPLGDGTGGPGYGIPPEISRPHLKGSLAMARTSGPPESTPSSGSQFYITLDAQPSLDGMYTVFGQATDDSFAVIDQIRAGDVINKVTITEK